MKKLNLSCIIAVVLASILTWGSVFGAGGGAGGGGGNGGGSGGAGSDFGDLVVLLRDADGIPILTDGCLQPIAADGSLIPLDTATCSVQVGSETLLQPVDFGRMSVVRSPASVIDSQLAELLVDLATAQCITLDPAGRLMLTRPDPITGLLTSKAVDAPLQNLAIYREMMRTGTLGSPAFSLPAPFSGYGFIDLAAKALGSTSDKEGKIRVDEVVYLNQILGLSDKATATVLPKKCINVKQEVQGQMTTVEKCFLNYSSYRYTRSQTYGSLPHPPYINSSTGSNGIFEYLALYPELQGPAGKPLFWITTGPVAGVVFPNGSGGASDFSGSSVSAFAQASDDARAVIDFMHSYPVLEGYGTPIPCTVATAKSEVVLSDLQVPVSAAVATTREGTVVVENQGPDPATGTVTLTGVITDGTTFLSKTFDFAELAAGTTKSFGFAFTAPTSPTTITWTASVAAANDVQTGNNSMTMTTEVIPTGTDIKTRTSITSPLDGATFAAPATIPITATAVAEVGATVAKVEFFAGTILIATATGTSPFTVTWNDVPAGSYSLTSKVTDSLGGTATSAPVGITVAEPVSSTIILTAPEAGATSTAPASIVLAASATAGTGATISKVDFYAGNTLVGTATAAPYSVTWNNVPAGSYTITAKVTDSLGGTATSAPVTVTVIDPVPASVTITSPASGSSFVTPATISITATATAGTGATISKVDFYAGNTVIGTATASPYSVTWSNVTSAGEYSVTAKVTDSLGGTATSPPVSVIVLPLPSPWLTQDIGTVAFPGSATFANGVFTIKGSGSDINGTSDGFRFVYKPLTGNGQMIARVVSLVNTNYYAKAGVMIRQSLAANSSHALICVTPRDGAEFLRRTTTGGWTYSTHAAAAAPYWVKLVRTDNTFTASVSPDGVTWTQVGSTTVTMTGTVYIGLAVNAHTTTSLTTAVIDNVQ